MLAKKIIKYSGFSALLATAVVLFFLRFSLIIVVSLVVLSLFLLFFIKTKTKTTVFTLNDFIMTFTHFRVALDSDANVFYALSASLEAAREPVKTAVKLLHEQMMIDHSVTPYLTFAKSFDNTIVTHIMINIYLLINHGVDQKRLWQFNYIFESLIKMNHEETVANHNASYERFDLFLYIGTGLVLITILLNVMTLIGGILNG